MVKLPNQVKNMIEDYCKEMGYDKIEEIKNDKVDFALKISSSNDKTHSTYIVQKDKNKDDIKISIPYTFGKEFVSIIKNKDFQYTLKKGFLFLGLEYSFLDLGDKYNIAFYDSIRIDNLDKTSFLETFKKIRFGKTLFSLETNRVKVTPIDSTKDPRASDVGVF